MSQFRDRKDLTMFLLLVNSLNLDSHQGIAPVFGRKHFGAKYGIPMRSSKVA